MLSWDRLVSVGWLQVYCDHFEELIGLSFRYAPARLCGWCEWLKLAGFASD